jgi:hypothetical protein
MYIYVRIFCGVVLEDDLYDFLFKVEAWGGFANVWFHMVPR